jgi:TPR repeat protein
MFREASMLKRVLAGAAVAAMLWTGAWAGDLEDGVAAYKDGDFALALQLWRQLADKGHAIAQFNVGLLYEKGHGVPKDTAEAVRWYERAAENGDVISQFKLGLIYVEGRDTVRQDYDKAAKWYLRAAEKNHVRAQYSLGNLYANGRGVPQDSGKAFEWYERAESTSCTYGDIALIEAPRLS